MSDLFGIDLGFGQVKVVYSNNGIPQYLKYPSVVGQPPAFELNHETFGRKLEDWEKMIVTEYGAINETETVTTWYVGKKALAETDNARLTFKADKTDRDTDRIKYLNAIGYRACQLDQHDYVGKVVTGLPVYEYNDLKNKLEQNMCGHFGFVYAKDFPVNANIEQVAVIPQSAGAFYDVILGDGVIVDRQLAAADKVVVIDIGFRTTDVVTMNKSKYSSTSSFTLFKGISNVHMELVKALNRDFHLNKKLAEIDEIYRSGQIKLRNELISIDKQISDSLKPVAEEIIEDIQIRLPDYREMSAILLTGGGGTLLESYFKREYGDMVIVIDNPEYSNAMGYYKYGRLLQKNGKM